MSGTASCSVAGFRNIGFGRRLFSAAVLSAAVLATVGLPDPWPAAPMELPPNEVGVTGYFDTTVSMGGAMRVSERDGRLVALANGGRAFSFNEDDGNLNYDRGDSFPSTPR